MDRKLGAFCALFAACCVFVIATPPSSAGQCIQDRKDVKLSRDEIVKFNDYLCRSDDGASVLRVQFQRLSEAAAGVVLAGGSAPWFGRLYGKPKILENEVWREYKTLVDRFGQSTHTVPHPEEGLFVSLSIGPHARADASNEAVHLDGKTALRSIAMPPIPDLPLLDETLHILTKPDWPPALRFDYGGEDTSPDDADARAKGNFSFQYSDLKVWRYLTREDFANYQVDLKRLNALIDDKSLHETTNVNGLALLDYLTGSRWPDNFLYASTSIQSDEPCLQLDFFTSQYDLIVDIVEIENRGAKSATLDQLLGGRSADHALREGPSAKASGRPGRIDMGSLVLEPGKKLIIPLKISLRDANQTEVTRETAALTQAPAVYQQIQASAPQTTFKADFYTLIDKGGTAGAETGTFTVSKIRESFKPHSPVVPRTFYFGPEWWLAGLSVNGEPITFAGDAANFVDLTAGSGLGSCPILYTWNSTEGRWIRKGKIIHTAQMRVNEASQTIAFDGLVSTFKIVEEELELSHLNEAHLRLELKNGETRQLRSTVAALSARDGDYVRLHAWDGVEIDFVLPSDLKAEVVRRSMLTVTGYYDRYSTLLIAQIRDRKQSMRPAASTAPASINDK